MIDYRRCRCHCVYVTEEQKIFHPFITEVSPIVGVLSGDTDT